MQHYKYLQNIPLNCIHSSGKCIGKNNNSNIFVNFGIPGENVNLKVAKRQKRGYIAGSIEQINEPSQHRVTPICKHFGVCGGCNWMHISYEEQLKLKKEILINAFQKYEIISPEIPNVIPSPKIQYYRNKTDYAFSTKTGIIGNKEVYLGFHPIEDPFSVLEIDECFLQSEILIQCCKSFCNQINQYGYKAYDFYTKQGLLRSLTIRTSTIGECMVNLGFSQHNAPSIEHIMLLLKDSFPQATSLNYTILTNIEKAYFDGIFINTFGKPLLEEQMDNLKFGISPKSFYQPNPLQAKNVYEKIKLYTDLSSNSFVFDMYTGAGTIACSIAGNANKVMGIEGCKEAIEDANNNAILNQIQNTVFLKGDILETFTKNFVDQYPHPDAIIIDPPRAGTLIEIKKSIIYANPRKIIYVSCNPVSLAWDLKQLTETYTVTAIQPFDMFPHTHHVETVVMLEKRI